MPRYNTSLPSKTITGTHTIATPDSGAFIQLAGTAPYTVTLPASAAFPGQEFTFHNTTSGTVTLSTPSGAFTGLGASGTATQALLPNTVTSVVSDSVNYVTLSEDGSVLFATDATVTGNLTVNTAGTTAIISPGNLTINPSNPGSVNNVNIGAGTRGTAAFTSLTANSAVTLTANTTSSGTSTGTLVVTGGVGVSGTVYAGALNGPLTGTVQTAAQPNITSLGTLTGLTVTNTITGSVSGSAATAGTVTNASQPNITSLGTLTDLTVTNTITGSVSGSAATATTAGTVTTAAQPNITSLGTLTSLTVSGNVTLSSTGAVQLPSGTIAQRPAGVGGLLRYNTQTSAAEYYSGGTINAWIGIGIRDGSSPSAAAPSGYYLAQNFSYLTSGYYWIQSTAMPAPLRLYVDMTEEGGGYDFYPIQGGTSVSSINDTHSGKALGMELVMPRSKFHWRAMRNFVTNVLGSSDYTYFSNVIGIYRSGTSVGGNYTSYIMRNPSSYGSGAPDWRVLDGGRWWLRDTTYSEPNGDYTLNGFLGNMDRGSFSGGTYDLRDLLFNDGASYATGGFYLVSTNAKP